MRTPEYWLGKIEELKVDPEAVEKINAFFDEPENQNLSEQSKTTYAWAIYSLLKYTRKPLAKIGVEDVKKYLKYRRKSGISPATTSLELVAIRRFLRYVGVKVDFKLRQERKEKFPVDPSQFLNNSEFEKLLSVLSHPRDKALIMLLRETGIRIGEALALDVRDVEFTERYGRLHIRKSKTAERYVEFVRAIPYVKAWLSVHPDPKPNNPLFVTLRGEIRRLDYEGVRSVLRRALKKANLKKRVHPHLFRHQVATELLSLERLPEEAVRIYLGWKHGSRMVSRYSHVTSKKANELVMRARYGIKTREEKEEPRGYRECPRCGRMVEVKYKYCPHCGLVLERKIMIKEKELLERVDKLLDLLRENPQLVDQLRELVENRKI